MQSRQYKAGVQIVKLADPTGNALYHRVWHSMNKDRRNAAKRAAYDPAKRAARHLRYKEKLNGTTAATSPQLDV